MWTWTIIFTHRSPARGDTLPLPVIKLLNSPCIWDVRVDYGCLSDRQLGYGLGGKEDAIWYLKGNVATEQLMWGYRCVERGILEFWSNISILEAGWCYNWTLMSVTDKKTQQTLKTISCCRDVNTFSCSRCHQHMLSQAWSDLYCLSWCGIHYWHQLAHKKL